MSNKLIYIYVCIYIQLMYELVIVLFCFVLFWRMFECIAETKTQNHIVRFFLT